MSRAAVLAAVLSGACCVRALLGNAYRADAEPVPPRIPLDRLPMDVVGPGWEGEDVPLDPDVAKRAKVTAYLQRGYVKDGRSLWVYVGYVGKWSPESIHHPAVCFPGSGFELVSDGVVTVPSPPSSPPLRFREFLWRSPGGGGTYTLSTFVHDGRLEPDEWRLRWDGVFGIDYFAVLTISGTHLGDLEASRDVFWDVARRVTPALLEHFPSRACCRMESVGPRVRRELASGEHALRRRSRRSGRGVSERPGGKERGRRRIRRIRRVRATQHHGRAAGRSQEVILQHALSSGFAIFQWAWERQDRRGQDATPIAISRSRSLRRSNEGIDDPDAPRRAGRFFANPGLRKTLANMSATPAARPETGRPGRWKMAKPELSAGAATGRTQDP